MTHRTVAVLILLLGLAGCGTSAAGGGAAASEKAVKSAVPAKLLEVTHAIEAGETDRVRAALDAHPEWLEAYDNRWDSHLLHYAAWEQKPEIVRLLIKLGADVNARNRYGWTPLHEASERGNIEIITCLLDHGAEIEAPNREGCTPLYVAANEGKTEAVALLLARGANADTRNENGWTLLHGAAIRGDADQVRMLLERGATVDARSKRGRTPLHWAATPEVARLLLDAGADVAARGDLDRTPLHLAAFFGDADVARLLLGRGAAVDTADKYKLTPLLLARMEGHEAVARLLADRGADASRRLPEPPKGRTVTVATARGALMLDGKPFIPFGVWQQPEYLMEYHRNLGINCMVWPPSGGSTDESSNPAYVHAAEKAGVGAIVHFHQNLVGMRGVWGWIGGGWPMPEARRTYELIRSRDPYRIIQVNFGGHSIITGEDDQWYREAFRYVDCVVPHAWPEMFDGEPRNLRNVAIMVDRIRELTKDRPRGEVSIWPDMNPHMWHQRKNKGWTLYKAPTPEEFTFEVWSALIHGADGISIFPISFDPFVYAQIPAKMEERLPGIIGEVQQYAEVLAADESPEAIRVTGSDSKGIVDWTTRRLAGQDTVFVLNGTALPQKVRLELDGLAQRFRVLDARDKLKEIAVSGDTLEMPLGALELRIWRLVPKAAGE